MGERRGKVIYKGESHPYARSPSLTSFPQNIPSRNGSTMDIIIAVSFAFSITFINPVAFAHLSTQPYSLLIILLSSQ